MPSDAAPRDESRLLHPATLLFTLGSAAWRLLVPALAVLVLARGDSSEIWFAVLFGPAAAAAIVRFVTFRYVLAADELVVRRGLLFRNERHVPYARIQSIDLVQNVLHRMLGVAEVRVQTASGDEAEATFKVLSLAAVDTMRARVFRGRPGSERPAAEPGIPAEGPRVLATMPPGEIVLYGLISNRGLVLVLAALGFWAQYTAWEGPRRGAGVDPSDLVRSLSGWLSSGGLLTVVFGVAAAIVALRILSVGHAAFAFSGFTLHAAGDDLRTVTGLLTRHAITIPRHRIQIVVVRETPLHRLFGRVSVRVETAGGHGGESHERQREDWLVPLLRKDRLAALLREVQPEIDVADAAWRPVDRRAWRRLLFRRSLVALGAFAVCLPLGTVAAATIAGVLLGRAALTAPLEARSLQWAVQPAAILVREGWWTRLTRAARVSKIQAIAVTTTPFDRRLSTATVSADTAAHGRGDLRLRVRFLPAAEAAALAGALEDGACRTTFRW